MILTNERIAAAVKAGMVKIAPWSATQLHPASYALRVGSEGITAQSKRPIDIKGKGLLTLSPGDFGIVLTCEELELDRKHTACIDLCDKYTRKGIIATTDPNVEPGYRGRLKIGLTNLSLHPVSFHFEDNLATIRIHSLAEAASQGYDGPDQGETALSAEDITAIAEGENMGFAKILDTLDTLSTRVDGLTTRVDGLTTRVDGLTTNVGGLTAQVQRLTDQGELLQERFELAQEQNNKQFENIQKQFENVQKQFELAQQQNEKQFENVQKQFELTQQQNEKQFELTQRQNERQFEQIQNQFQDIRWWLRWAVALVSVVITLLVTVIGWFIIGS